MDAQAKSFIDEMAQRLDASLSALEQEETRLAELIGEERTAELRAFWLGEFDEVDAEEMRRTLDFDDRLLITTWIRLKRNRSRRAMAGRGAMIRNAERDDLEIIPTSTQGKP